MFETVVKDQLDTHLNSVNYFSAKLHCFLLGRSAVSDLLETDAIIADWCNNNTAIIFDFHRVFDKVPHNLLFNVLENCNPQKSDLFWLESFLIGKTQQVRFNSCLSPCDNVLSRTV